ncbi:cytochrome c oxidase subunit 3 family protein [Xanthobacter versatilis]|uniref:cytochrome c oxidase subunit 3 family protein n=1 Tax=Xanthobacter autotrophicus (strain ATCC BAA-1158 / Py2) TaxID=78245 RepID=UPI003729185D
MTGKERLLNGRPREVAGRIPGEPGIWLFIAGDCLLFSALFIVFLLYRAEDPAIFGAGRAELSQVLGLCNTLLMLTSSWFVAIGVEAAHRHLAGVPQRCFGAALACGAAFGAVKFFEYREKIAADITPTTNDFFMFYFVYTGIHMIHVFIGMIVLYMLIIYTRQHNIRALQIQHLQTGAGFWHLVDLLWIVLFPLLYLTA